jgi:hypothetical protein
LVDRAAKSICYLTPRDWVLVTICHSGDLYPRIVVIERLSKRGSNQIAMSNTQEEGELSEAQEKFLDTQIMSAGAFALIALIACVVLLFLFANGVAGFGPALQSAASVVANRIKATFPGAFAQMQTAITTVEAQVATFYHQSLSSVGDGATQVLNVVIAAGNSVISTIQNGIVSFFQLLSEMGGDILQFFSQVFPPVVTTVQILGTVTLDILVILVATFQPLVTLIDALVNAINQIGHKF